MAKILGLDLGTNSIGWAIVDDINNKIIDSGVRIFPEGVVAKTIGQGEKEESKNASRRNSRQQRRGFYRKRLRKIKLLRTLINLEMCPLSHSELDVWSKWDKQKKKEGRMAPEIYLPENHPYCLWLKQNPYLLRDKALNEDLTLQEFGRVLYHLIQRRGFLSNRKGKDDGKIYKGKDGVKGIEDTQKELQNSTLGKYLFDILPKDGEPFKVIQDENGNELRVRSRYTLRDMYVAEFEAIWNRQAINLGLDTIEYTNEKKILLKGGLKNKRNNSKIGHLKKIKGAENVEVIELIDELSTNDKQKYLLKIKAKLPLKEFLAGKIEKNEEGDLKFKSNESVLFWQRPLRSQKGLLAKCRFEPDLKDENGKFIQKGKTPCHLSHPLYEEYRALQYINNIEYGKKQRLEESQRLQVLELINSKDKKFDFIEIKKKLKLEYETFNYADDFPVVGNYTTKHLNSLFPKAILDKEYIITVNEQETIEYGYERIWHLLHYCDDNDLLLDKLQDSYGLSEAEKEKVSKINLKEDYSNVSLKAIKNILPYLKKGLHLSDAVILGGVRNAFGKKWELYKNDHIELEKDLLKINHEKSNKEGEAIEKIKVYLIENKYGFVANDIRFKKMYHHSQEVLKVEEKDKIDTVQNLRNPIVQQGVNETRRLVNELIAQQGKFDQIRVELGRDLKNSKTKREELGYKIRENDKKNEKAKELLIEFGLRQSRENIQKVLLYQEMPISVCPYTNKTINISDVLGKGNKFQIEHIIPKSISLDDSFANKTLCDSKFNGLKGNRTPHDFYEINKDPNLWGGAKSWEEIERRAFKVLPYPKAKRFVSKTKFETNDFIQRQLNDTRYISKKTSEILSQVCSDVRVMPGSLTAELRRLWGLNNILQPIMTVDIPNLHIEENKHIPHYVVLDNDKKPILSQRIYFDKPTTKENETLLSGSIEKGVFKSKEQYVKFQVDVPDLANGDYWAKLVLSNPKNIVQVFKDKPNTLENEIVLRGKIEKEKFKNDGLNAINVNIKENGTYWTTFSIVKKDFIKPTKEDQPKKNGKQILLFGEVKDGLFSSYIYDCEAEIEDGKYWLIIDVDFEKVTFEKALNEKPQVRENQILIQGTTNDENIFVSDMDNQHHFEMEEGKGKYYVLFDIVSEVTEFSPVKTALPVLEEGQTLVEGTTWVDKYTGEIKFDPIKNREDHRHHAIDALVIALTKESFFQRLSKQNASTENKKRGNEHEKEHLDFPEPWNGFHSDAKNVINSILISHKQNKNILTKITKKITKNGQTFKSEGMAVRGQLHFKSIYGKNKNCNKDEFVRRVDINSLSFSQLTNVLDNNLRKVIIEEIVKKMSDEETQFFNKMISKEKNLNKTKQKQVKDKVDKILKNTSFFMPNIGNRYKRLNKIEKDDFIRTPVPIKKVRVKSVLGNAESVNAKIKQFVDPQNNHHIVIYKDENDELKNDITNFWNVVERVKQKDEIYKLPHLEIGKPAPKELVLTFQENDMFLLGLSNDEYNDNKESNAFLSNYLYRVQNISDGDYTFRHHFASSVTNKNEGIRIASMKKYQEMNPIKVKVSVLGKISKI
ncbi:type II CRISPR RNA-guided endonuclease Cas9 [Flavobacterium marginilacus]|uniref:type II CRISPR RNA-guided endonuclease Cas9 n=1 Tax=Flavobacterium marginilacus TaxID=3003256 RepID=UPI00248D4552|nr:type II CRISPR RNA-guided endonuclease Cas9 [Flavobacterium marginilacus]